MALKHMQAIQLKYKIKGHGSTKTKPGCELQGSDHMNRATINCLLTNQLTSVATVVMYMYKFNQGFIYPKIPGLIKCNVVPCHIKLFYSIYYTVDSSMQRREGTVTII